jgi:hypothetical protein
MADRNTEGRSSRSARRIPKPADLCDSLRGSASLSRPLVWQQTCAQLQVPLVAPRGQRRRRKLLLLFSFGLPLPPRHRPLLRL